MDNKNLMLLGAGLVVAYVFLIKTNESGDGEREFYVDGVGYVKESQLAGYGYQKVNGQWYSAAQIAAASAQAGVPPGTTVDPTMATWNTILQILNGLIPLATTIITTVTQANRQATIQQILAKYTSPASPDYVPMFGYFDAQSMAHLTIPQLQKLLDTGGIAGIFGTRKRTYVPVKKKQVINYF
tara:strand:- start:721 stop:1272 length:552 start_codon:yes stop_codon:yes gene_type:complete